MTLPLRTQPIAADALAVSPVADAPHRPSVVRLGAKAAGARISRRRWRLYFVAANTLAWIAIIVIVRLTFF